MNAFKQLTTVSVLTILTCATQSWATGPSNGGGGDSFSQQFRNEVYNLPQVLATVGMVEFPEIDLSSFERAAHDSQYRVELKSNLKINGVPKAAISYPNMKLTQLDPNVWFAFNFLPDSEERKRALAFHELLVVLKIERNDDYHISNRLLTINGFQSEISPAKTIATVGQITSVDFGAPDVITAVNYSDKTSTFYYCSNRKNISSCHLLGRPGRYYSQHELSVLRAQLDNRVKLYRKLVVGVPAVLGIGGTGLCGLTAGISCVLGWGGAVGFGMGFGDALAKSKAYAMVDDLRVIEGQNDVIDNSPESSDRRGLIGNADDLNEVLLKLN